MEIIILVLLEIYDLLILNFAWQTFWIAFGSIATGLTGIAIFLQFGLQQKQLEQQREQIDEEKDARLFNEFERTYYNKECVDYLYQEVSQFYIHRDYSSQLSQFHIHDQYYSKTDLDYLGTFNFELNIRHYPSFPDAKKVFTYKGILIHPNIISHCINNKKDKTCYLNMFHYYSSLKRHFVFFDKEKFKTEHYKRRYYASMRDIIIKSGIFILFYNEILLNKKVIMEDDKFNNNAKTEVMDVLDFFMSFSTPQK